uniref:Uncharacterized protein n=1 Tax=Avena sativa TaxID=4498 RepID=A0ACD5YEQ7_AVESA
MSLLWSLLVAALTISTASAGDEAALLAFKARLGDGAMVSWNSSVHFCSWEGVMCSRRHQERVVALSLHGSALTGELSPALGNLTFLRTLNLSSNGLHGEIPASLGRLRRLRILELSDNLLSGTLPVNLSSCISLTFMALDNNKLGGRIPPVLGERLTSLTRIWLLNNSFTGPIPASLANLSDLQYLVLSKNQFVGPIPEGFGSIQSMEYFFVTANNLSGMIPPSFYNLSSLKGLGVGGNMLHGSIPDDIGNKFPIMQILDLDTNQFTGTIPSSLSNISHLTTLHLWGNRLTGYVPPTLGRLEALEILDLSANMLESYDSEGLQFITSLANCSQLRWLALGSNYFEGQLPGSIVNFSRTLEKFWIVDNRINGSIPQDIGNLVGLHLLTLAINYMSGVIPESIGKLENLIELQVYNNNLSGLLPSSLGNLSHLSRLYADSNNLEGPIPASLGKLKNIFVLDLAKNYRLNGSIPKDIFELSSLSWYLDLSYNALSGTLPSEVGSLTNLNTLTLSGNQLSGKIPEGIQNCIVMEWLSLDNNLFEGSIPQSLKNMKRLTVLNLTMNKLSGNIPDVLGSIRNLQELYLAHNNLSGLIPTVLMNLTVLWGLDLSYNDLLGEVPKGGVFGNLTSKSVTGNKQLCGGIPQLHLVPCSTDPVRGSKTHKWKGLLISLAATGAILLLISVIVIIWKLKKRQKSQAQPITTEEQFPRVSYQALFRGTSEFSESNLLGKGRYGAVYRCILHDDDSPVAVKVFDLQQSGSSKSFEAECESLRRVRHRYLIKIITCCSSIDPQGQDFKALVLDLMPNGSLDGWLHPKENMYTLNNTLSLSQRLDIAVQVVDALDYLHNHCQPPIVHCDVKPGNILLGEDMSA